MEYRPLKITLISAKDLEDPHVFTKMEVYAVVNINIDPRTELRTLADKEGGCNPAWNCTIKFIVEEAVANQNRLNLVIRLKSDGTFGPKDVGKVEVPIKEFLDRREKVFVHNVRLPKKKGTLNLCCEIGEKFSVLVAAPPHVTERGTSAGTPVRAFPAAWSSAVYPPPSSVAYPNNYSPSHGWYLPPPPQGWHPPPPPPGYGYTGNLPYGGHEYMQNQQLVAGLGQTPAGRLFSNLFIIGPLSNILADFTAMLNGGTLDGLVGWFL